MGNTDYTFFALDALKIEYNLNAARLRNLEETRFSTANKLAGTLVNVAFVAVVHIHTCVSLNFQTKIVSRLSAFCSAAGDIGQPLFVFKGKHVPFRGILQSVHQVVEAIGTNLTRVAHVNMREKFEGADSEIFYQWEQHFVSHVSDLTSGRGHIILAFDAYQSYVSFRKLQLFGNNRIIFHALLSKTSGKSRSCKIFCVDHTRGN